MVILSHLLWAVHFHQRHCALFVVLALLLGLLLLFSFSNGLVVVCAAVDFTAHRRSYARMAFLAT